MNITKKRGQLLICTILLLVFANLGLAVNGCYYESGSPDYCTVISDTQATDKNYFNPGSDCSSIPECEEISCTATCDTEFLGKCQAQGGKKIDNVNVFFSDWCSQGCCDVGSFCDYVYSKWECVEKAKIQTLTENDIKLWLTTLVAPDLTVDKCLNQYCKIQIEPATLTGTILDIDKKPLSGVTIETVGEIETSETDGTYTLQLNPGTHLVKASLNGYLSVSKSVTLAAKDTKELNFTLVKTAKKAVLSGSVKDSQGTLLKQATVSWSGPTSGYVVTDDQGNYEIKDLEFNGKYTVTASKIDYTSKTETITLDADSKTKDFVLDVSKFQGISGYIWIDKDSDGVGDEKVHGANIYVDGVFKGVSQFADPGIYKISLTTGTHEIDASYLGYQLPQKYKFVVSKDQEVKQKLVLTKYIGECSPPNPPKDVKTFTASHVLGEEKVLLKWTKPCPEVSAYEITKFDKDGKQIGDKKQVSPIALEFIDNDVKWRETYTYEIVAVYAEGGATRYSKIPAKVSITLGYKDCEGRTSGATFCLVGDTERKIVWTCDDQNKKVAAKDCSIDDYSGHSYYCARIGTDSAACKDSGACDFSNQLSDPFGLYYDRQKCYGASSSTITPKDTANYCYFDYTKTVVDECNSCTDVKSCFDYQSKDSCEINNCLGTTCKWISSTEGISIYKGFENILILPVTQETGHGYCTEKDYQKDDQCVLCGPDSSGGPGSPGSTLFENYYCTAEVCSSLGSCFSKQDLSACYLCGDKPNDNNNCYSYGTKLECTGDQDPTNKGLKRDTLGEITLSKDQCNWGRCRWEGIDQFNQHGCIKDGDGDGKDDCAYSQFTIGEKNSCKKDNQAPSTKIIPEGAKVVSTAYPELTFQGTDKENSMGTLHYCLSDTTANAVECSDFKNKVPYPGKLSSETVKVDLITTLFKSKIISGETYRIRYYSKDKYFNQENVQEDFVFVDNEPPKFTIESDNVTSAGSTDLTVYLSGLNEPMDCTFDLKPILPSGTVQTDKIDKTKNDKQVSYKLNGIIYDLDVECVDEYGNTNKKTEKYVFDLEQGIDIVYPVGAISKTEFTFQAKTIVGSVCELYTVKDNKKIADFITDSTGKDHATDEISLAEGDYRGVYKIACRDLLNNELKEDYFSFQIDLSGPKTQIILKEGKRTIKPTAYGWKEQFVEKAEVTFGCTSAGLSCKDTNYCLGDGCEYKNSPNYKKFTQSFTIDKNIDICYYSDDDGGNSAYPVCGKVIIDGFGITLTNPPQYFYQNEKWGVSNKPVFDLRMITKIPTTECRFDFLDDFNFDKVEYYKILKKEINEYIFKDFPGDIIPAYRSNGGVKTIYVKCKDYAGKIGPVQKLNLEYDPSAPEIEKAYAEPDKLNDGIETGLYVNTDDKTVCKYDEGKSEFSTMSYSFPGLDDNILHKNHQAVFSINFQGTKKTFLISTQCQNAAGDLSKVKNITFKVDYTAQGNIISTKPSGYISGQDVILEVITNKNARCTYDRTKFQTTNGRTHQQSLGNLKEGDYSYLINCLVGGEDREATIKFTVDNTAPKITSINDGSYSCSLSKTPNIYVYTDEKNISSYYYELYESSLSSNSTGSGNMIDSGTVDAEIPFKIKASLTENTTYYLKVKAGDAAGNLGSLEESDGFIAVSGNFDKCVIDSSPPVVTFTVNETCTATQAEMECHDETSCSFFNYEQSYDSGSCNPGLSYNGQKISFSKNGWLCYYAEDNVGNNVTEIKKIDFGDSDGDGVSDTCDKCDDTKAGKIVDNDGCGYDQGTDSDKKADADGDGLPDYWEKLFDAIGCELDYTNQDSTNDGVFDDQEDYDGDSYTNYEEYNSGYNPCVSDAPEKDKVDVVIDLKTKEVSLLALTLLIIGLVFVIGGSSYLIYYYKFRHPVTKAAPVYTPSAGIERITKPLAEWKQKILALRKRREAKEKFRKRRELFGTFNNKSQSHIKSMLRKKAPHPSRLHGPPKKFERHREKIKSGLRKEKSIFSRLGEIAKKKDTGKVSSKKETKNIFDRLKEINKKKK